MNYGSFNVRFLYPSSNATLNYGIGALPIDIKIAQLATFANSDTKQQGYKVTEVNKLISTMLTGWNSNGNKPKSMSNNYLELILSCNNGFVVKKRLQFPHIIAWQNDSTPYNIADVYKEFSLDNWLKADDFENPDITLVVEPTDEILTTSTATPPEVTTTNSGRFYLYYRNLPVGINRIHIDFHIKTKTEPIDFDLEVIDGLSWKDAQTILASNDQAKINVLLSGVKDVYNFTGTEGDFEDITMYEWSELYQQIISLKPNNKFTHDLYFYIYDESELNTKLTDLELKVETNKRTLDLNISDSNPYIIEYYQYINGLIPEGSTILSNTNWISYYIPVSKGEVIRITVNTHSARTGYTNDIPKLRGDFQGYISHPTSNAANNTVFESPIDGYFVVGLVNTATIQFYKENNGIGNRVKQVEENTSILGEESSRLDNKTEKISRDLYSNLSDDGNYVIQAKTIDGLIPQGSSILGNNTFTLYYIKVFKGEVISGSQTGEKYLYICFTENIPKLNEPSINYDFWSILPKIQSPIDGYFCVGVNKPDTVELYINNSNSHEVRITNLENKTSDLDNIREDIYGKIADVSFQSTEGSTISHVIKGNFVAGETYIINVKKGFGNVFTRYFLFGVTESDYINQQEFLTPNAEYIFPEGATSLFFRVSDNAYISDTVEIEVVRKSAIYPTLETIIGETSEYEYNIPNYVFAINNVNGISTPQAIYLEGLVDRAADVELDNGAVKYVNPTLATENVNTYSDTITLGKDTHNYSVVTTKSSILEGKLIKHLVIGDSWAAAMNKSLKKEDTIPWNYASTIANEIHKIIKDGGLNCKFVALGTGNYIRRQGEYKGESYELYSNNEGRGGWSAATYLRHPDNVRHEGAGNFNGKVAWDACGLGRKQVYGNAYDESAAYEEYVTDVEHINRYLMTAMGYYHWDYSTELLNHCGVSGEYTGTSSQKEAIDTYMENLLNNPANPFYDRDVAMSSQGKYAFSLAKYIERYKTLEDDGETRLVMGSTAGTFIQYNSQITNYNVCTPTHVTIELGVNDYRGLSNEQRAADIEKMAELITAYNSNIKVGFVQVHVPGVFNPQKWNGIGKFSRVIDWTVNVYVKKLFSINKILSEKYNTPNGVNGIYFVPTYYTHGFTRAGAYQHNLPNGREIIIDGTDDLHPAIDVYQEIGYQILCWLLYTL